MGCSARCLPGNRLPGLGRLGWASGERRDNRGCRRRCSTVARLMNVQEEVDGPVNIGGRHAPLDPASVGTPAARCVLEHVDERARAAVALEALSNPLRNRVGLADFGHGISRAFDAARIGDGNEQPDRTTDESTLHEATEAGTAEPLLLIVEQSAKEFTLSARLLYGGGHARSTTAVDADKLALRVHADDAVRTLRFDDDHAEAVDDEVVDLGDFAASRDAKIVDDVDVLILGEGSPEVEGHLPFRVLTRPFELVARWRGVDLLVDHRWAFYHRATTRYGEANLLPDGDLATRASLRTRRAPLR